MKRSAGSLRLVLVLPALAATLLAAPDAHACPCSLWGPEVVPANLSANDTGAVELGVRFRAATSGTISAIRFYKSADNGGAHVGNLWTNTGGLLATVNFEGETASGWQQAQLATPIAVEANTLYVVSYHTQVGHYSFDGAYFAADRENGPLVAPASATAGGNGVFTYGAASVFPSNSFNATNYWVDVVFEDGAPDPNPPSVVSTTPAAGAARVSVTDDVLAVFSKAMDATSIDAATFVLRDAGGNVLPATVTYEAGAFRARLRHSSPLAYSATYTATLTGGPDGVRALDGQPLAADYVWSFATAAPPADEGPGGPILIVTSAASPFSRYYVEILTAEGLNSYRATDLSTLTPAVLQTYDVVILGEMALSASQVAMLTDWVNAGGNLVAMRPDPQLASLLGLSPAGSALSDAYLQVDASVAPGKGIVAQTIQYHGRGRSLSRQRSHDGGHSLLGLGHADRESRGHAARRRQRPCRRVRLRPRALGGLHAPGQPGVGGDGARRLVAHPAERSLLPRLREPRQGRHPPGGRAAAPAGQHRARNADRPPAAAAAVVPAERAQGRDRALRSTTTTPGSGTRDTFDKLDARSPAGCSVADWTCLRATSWGYTGISLTDAQAADYQTRGFELGCTSAPTARTGRRRRWKPPSRTTCWRTSRSSRPWPRSARTARTASRGATGRPSPRSSGRAASATT
jgi:hypothetical protein